MITGKTSSGFEYQIDERYLADYRYLKLAGDVTKAKTEGEALCATSAWISATLGDEQEERLVQHVADNNGGYAPYNLVFAEFEEIIQANKDVKN